MSKPDPERTAAMATAFAVGYSTALSAVEQLMVNEATRGNTDATMRAALEAGFSAGLRDSTGDMP